MPENKEKDILQKMMEIGDLIEQGKENEDIQVGTINYYKDFVFQGSNLAETDIFVAKIENARENTTTYELYSGKTNTLIATVDEQGKLHFLPEYIESLKQVDERLVQMLNLEDLDFVMPEELEKEDKVLTREERQYIASKKATSIKDNGTKTEKEEVAEQEDEEKTPEEKQKEQIAKRKKVPSHNILMIRANSNLYKDHPNLEPNLYFYRDNQGVVKAEYIDSNGEPQQSKYFEDSTTSLRQETVSIGDNGNPVTKEVPHQVMKTKGLNNVDKDIRDIRINIKIDTYGYLDIEEARQGQNGEWLSHDVEVQGRSYNSHSVNTTTSIRSRVATPDRQTTAYEKVAQTGLKEDGIEYSEMYLIQHPNELIESLIQEGYQKPEAVQIFNYMIGEKSLSLEEAKEKVNEEIAQGKLKEKETSEVEQGDEEEGRTPWGDAEDRRNRR
ncbi:MAG: hypothetical protein HFJ30_04905 [Clostridia bacterium]|nr:hypothetical protein [Clostridia bacterium]MCI9412935.1 hypothetical protein [Clostridia bacterium]